MSLSGSFDTMPLPELLSWLDTTARSGRLTIDSLRAGTTLVVDNHRITGCQSSEPPTLLGQFLLFHGAISEETLQVAMREQDRNGRRLGEILLDGGSISAEVLDGFLAAKAEETILSTFDVADARFDFDGDTRPPRGVLPVSMPIHFVIAKGLRRIEETAEAALFLEQRGQLLRRTDRRPSPRIGAVWPLRQAYEAVNGARTVEEIALHVYGTRAQVLQRLYELYKEGYIELATPERSVALLLPPSILEEPLTSINVSAELPSLVPRRIAEDETALNSVERYLLSRCDGTKDVRSIAMVAPIRPWEVADTIRSLLSRGLLEVGRRPAG